MLVPSLLALLDRDLRLDEQLALTLLAIALAGLIHAFSYTAAESADPTERWVFRRSADGLVMLAVYVIVRVWV